MARVTVEDCTEIIPNRFELIHLVRRRVDDLNTGAPLLVRNASQNKVVVVALREIAAGKVIIIRPDGPYLEAVG